MPVFYLCYNFGMFTGIIEEIGKVIDYSKLSDGARVKVGCSKVLEDIQLGDSIAIDGCCQTVVEIGSNYFCADVSEETLKITSFSGFRYGKNVNLERALTPATRLGGHIVQGHIDSTAIFIMYEKLSNFYNLTFEVPNETAKYIVNKGSVAINGVSLTVANISGNIFKVAVIPHTYKNTTLSELKGNDIVNIETDILGRYIEKFLSSSNNNSELNKEFLIENGFI